MADVFDNEVPTEWRDRLWDLVRECRNLRWQFVTKRIVNAAKMLPADWSENFAHCGLIVTVACQADADRDVPRLLDTPAAWRGVSYEPAVEGVNFLSMPRPGEMWDWLTGEHETARSRTVGPHLDWVIVGGESGARARPFHLDWARLVVAQCYRASVPVFVKQLGDKPRDFTQQFGWLGVTASKKGKDMSEWPESIRVRQMPRVYDRQEAA